MPKTIKKLISISDEAFTLQLIKKINQGEKVSISISSNGNEKKVMSGGKSAFSFDVCRCGNVKYNAVSVIRDLLKKHYSEGHWTRKDVESLVIFE
ncbi:MAG: hypothetical protein WC606_00720 [Candidatus Absconditabacterales bacterium]|jgi:hypothetical protein